MREPEKLSTAGRSDVATEALLSEIRHAASNLVQRMYYWTDCLEHDGAEKSAAGAVNELRCSLDALHRLVARTMDLLRPARVRAVKVAGTDVVRSIAARVGAAARAWDLVQVEAGAPQLVVDPLVLDRALATLAEVLGTSAAERPNGRATLVVEIAGVQTNGAAGRRALRVSIHATPPVRAAATDCDTVEHDVAFALSAKLLAELGWSLYLRERSGAMHVDIVIPLTV